MCTAYDPLWMLTDRALYQTSPYTLYGMISRLILDVCVNKEVRFVPALQSHRRATCQHQKTPPTLRPPTKLKLQKVQKGVTSKQHIVTTDLQKVFFQPMTTTARCWVLAASYAVISYAYGCVRSFVQQVGHTRPGLTKIGLFQ